MVIFHSYVCLPEGTKSFTQFFWGIRPPKKASPQDGSDSPGGWKIHHFFGGMSHQKRSISFGDFPASHMGMGQYL